MNEVVMNLIKMTQDHEYVLKLLTSAQGNLIKAIKKDRKKIFLLTGLTIFGLHYHDKQMEKLRAEIEDIKNIVDQPCDICEENNDFREK